ncbi:transglutaminase-like domain-containing protein [Galbitalea soli]|uniref:Transglutaminase family protein n=1 Tax=Galbitalea soli TaxID=1268042 RepID=A0A7C9TP89_9MICO|nr:transglutaminase family protein [Galbitalea soli]NEM90478.1 transglutaminase family protein [Galbitalea soli]NYJ31190.1 transglutaminase-like putative cysteine protease [Galbitalea soli]
MLRTISVHLELAIQGHTNMVFSMTPALGAEIVSERLDFSLAGVPQQAREIVDVHGTRLHTFVTGRGPLSVDYALEVAGRAAPPPVDERDLITYLRPSRYCESDLLTPTARSEFRGLSGHVLVQAVVDWVFERLAYVSGSSLPTDGAARTLYNRQGVCRDFAHLTIALLRAMEVPARMVAVFAPGLSPMDFHAVVEAFVDGAWWLVDATHLAPRQSMLRISTGRDAADTAWLTSNWTDLSVMSMLVTVAADSLPYDDGYERIQLG